MRILVISDSHGAFSSVQDVIARVGEPDMLIHCGDVVGDPDYIRGMVKCPCHIVRGNCDYDSELPLYDIIPVAGHRIFVTHGHWYHVKSGLEILRDAARSNEADIVLYGHTHEPYTEYGQISIANPGSIMGDKPSYMLLEFDQHGQPFFSLNHI